MPTLFWILFGVLAAVAAAALIVGAIALHKSDSSASAASEDADDDDVATTTPGPDEGSWVDSTVNFATFPSPAVIAINSSGVVWPLTSASQPTLEDDAVLASLPVVAGDVATTSSVVIGAPFGAWTANDLSQPGNSQPISSSKGFEVMGLPVYEFTLANGIKMRAFVNKSSDATVGLVEGSVDASSVVTWSRKGDYDDMDGIMSIPYDGSLKLLIVNEMSGEGLAAYNASAPYDVFSGGKVLVRRDHDMDVVFNTAEGARELPTGVTALTDLSLTATSGSTAQVTVADMHGFDEITAYAVHAGTTVGTQITSDSVTSAGTLSLSSGMAVGSVYDIYLCGKLVVSGQPDLEAFSQPIKLGDSFTVTS